MVRKMKMQRTIVIRRDYLHYISKYNRFEKRHKNMSVHLSPCFRYVIESVFILLSVTYQLPILNHMIIFVYTVMWKLEILLLLENADPSVKQSDLMY